jgi:hypothetical protein
MVALPVTPAGEKPEVDSWLVIDGAGSVTPLAGGQTTSGTVEGGTHRHTDSLTVPPPQGTLETESYLSGMVSRASLSAFSRRRSLSFCLRRFDLDISRPEPEESELTEEMDRERRQDSQILIE